MKVGTERVSIFQHIISIFQIQIFLELTLEMYFFQIISNLVEMKTSKVLASLCLGLVSVSIQDVPRNMIFEFSHGISTNRSAFFVLSILPNIFRSLFRFQF